MAEPLVSLIIPAYVSTQAQASLLAATLATVDEQAAPPTARETIVVDDGSPFDIAGVVAAHPRTTLLRRSNGGSALARNDGIAAARGDLFVFLDADDYLLPEALSSGRRALEEHPECGFAIGRREEMTFEGDPVPWGVAASPRESELYITLLSFDWYIIPPSSVMFRRSVVEAVGGFRDPWGADDLDFYLRVARGHRGHCHDTPVTRYRRYSSSSSRDGERMLTSIRAVYARQWPLVRGNAVEERAFHRGLQLLTEIFRDCAAENLRDRLRAGQWRRALRSARVLARESPRLLAQETGRSVKSLLRGVAKRGDRAGGETSSDGHA